MMKLKYKHQKLIMEPKKEARSPIKALTTSTIKEDYYVY